ncbi:hypothetical protein HYPSUDRAFT_210231 [Hypholoma sublateritium FD-334 SS-4]|uniref:Uncharacterized protein n=1 Tax=Hypholoma sublateritium (strain FD-334 SS-4) TaxID=945553 RepID=A0A0D2KDU9_HYPSF|nr:hypothetical protein HYPSUDRAFT_210231 [Hypholoma sublateritium FD-334 SS-4]
MTQPRDTPGPRIYRPPPLPPSSPPPAETSMDGPLLSVLQVRAQAVSPRRGGRRCPSIHPHRCQLQNRCHRPLHRPRGDPHELRCSYGGLLLLTHTTKRRIYGCAVTTLARAHSLAHPPLSMACRSLTHASPPPLLNPELIDNALVAPAMNPPSVSYLGHFPAHLFYAQETNRSVACAIRRQQEWNVETRPPYVQLDVGGRRRIRLSTSVRQSREKAPCSISRVATTFNDSRAAPPVSLFPPRQESKTLASHPPLDSAGATSLASRDVYRATVGDSGGDATREESTSKDARGLRHA